MPGIDKARQGRVASNKQVLERLTELYYEVFAHDGYGDIRVEMRILRQHSKEIIIHCGKQYRFVVDYARPSCAAGDENG